MKLWGGRFTKETDKLVYNFNASISFKLPSPFLFQEHLVPVPLNLIHSSFKTLPISITPYLYPTEIDAPFITDPTVTEEVTKYEV